MLRAKPVLYAGIMVGVLGVSLVSAAAFGVLGTIEVTPGRLTFFAGERAPPGPSEEPLLEWVEPEGSLEPWGIDRWVPPVLTQADLFAPGEGKVPTEGEAQAFAHSFSRLEITGNESLEELADDAVVSGSGTSADPYLLERVHVEGDLVIQDTARALILRELYVEGQLRLNYIGEDLLVHHVYAADLRVNENVGRELRQTGGLFHNNEFSFVGQIRHFSGEFLDNEIGPRPQDVATHIISDNGIVPLAEEVVFNLDGFHGAQIHDNRFIGQVLVKIHGHYHGDCLNCTAHDHADEDHFPPDEEDAPAHQGEDGLSDQEAAHEHPHDDHSQMSHHSLATEQELAWLRELGLRSHHSVRYHSLQFHDNTIEVEETVALRYTDRAHNADDVTAASEPNPYLEDPHVHFPYVWIADNQLKGGGITVEPFNADDTDHVLPLRGAIRLEENTIEVGYDPNPALVSPSRLASGIDMREATGIDWLITGNEISFFTTNDDQEMPSGLPVVSDPPQLLGIRFERLDDGNVTITGNTVLDADLGLQATRFSESLWWVLDGNTFGTPRDVRTYNVANPPGATPEEGMEEADRPEEEEEEHEH